MKNTFLHFPFVLLLICPFPASGQNIDSLDFSISLNYLKDLSDTYGGGDLFSGEFYLHHSWFGACISYGHFQSQSTFVFKIPVEQTNLTLEIPFDEMAIMKTGSFSLIMIPIQKKSFMAELLIGPVLGRAKNSCFKSVDYSYNTNENRFTYLYKDYQLIKRTHFGYQVGINISFYFIKKFGIQVISRMQHLNNGGSFFFIGSGLSFRL